VRVESDGVRRFFVYVKEIDLQHSRAGQGNGMDGGEMEWTVASERNASAPRVTTAPVRRNARLPARARRPARRRALCAPITRANAHTSGTMEVSHDTLEKLQYETVCGPGEKKGSAF